MGKKAMVSGNNIQMRVVNEDIHHLVGRVAHRIAEQMRKGKPTNQEIGRVARVLIHVLKDAVVTSDVCGIQVLCEEGIAGSPWGFHRPSPLPDGRIWRYRVAFPGGAEGLIEDLSERVSRLYASSKDKRKGRALLRAFVASALFSELAPCLFVSDLCGATDLCKNARTHGPWDEKKHPHVG